LNGLEALVERLGGLDLLVICAGTGYINPELAWNLEGSTIAVNVRGFAVAANFGMCHFIKQGSGQLVAISSVAAIRGSGAAPAYNASKAFVSNYLEGLRQNAVRIELPIAVTDIKPGFVDTAVAKGDGLFWVAPVEKAVDQIYRAIRLRKSHVYVTRRRRLIGWLMKCLPRAVYMRM
jgi:short-subunit dehydrogenase